MTKKELLKLPICFECKTRDKELIYVQWSNKKYTCIKCIELAYHSAKVKSLE